MIGTISEPQFARIRDEIATHGVKLVICDFNGVLDDYYECKYAYLRDVLGGQNAAHLAALAVYTDTEYIRDRSASLEDSIRKYLKDHTVALTDAMERKIADGMQHTRITDNAQAFLASMPVPLVVYTAQSRAAIDEYRDAASGATWVSAQELGNPKPSVRNLEELMRQYEVIASEVCVIGDGLIDDLMPAKLLGMHTILVTPFTDVTIATSAY